jgi:nitrate reductase (cytochrome), electron transfer subunit
MSNRTPAPRGREPEDGGRSLHIFLAVIVGLAIIGFFAGTREHTYKALTLVGFKSQERPGHEVPPARSYSELKQRPWETNAHWQHELTRRTESQRGQHTDESSEGQIVRTPEDHARALEERSASRAYAGAPPTIPHPVRQTGAVECMACHGEGLRIDGKLAPAMSHPYMTNCTQCHVVSEGPGPFSERFAELIPSDNAFDGIKRHAPGWIAHDGAPPLIPHPTHMRENCSSCHGEVARPGLRTTHPWRQNCVQCHAPSADMDQRPASVLAPFWE